MQVYFPDLLVKFIGKTDLPLEGCIETWFTRLQSCSDMVFNGLGTKKSPLNTLIIPFEDLSVTNSTLILPFLEKFGKIGDKSTLSLVDNHLDTQRLQTNRRVYYPKPWHNHCITFPSSDANLIQPHNNAGGCKSPNQRFHNTMVLADWRLSSGQCGKESPFMRWTEISPERKKKLYFVGEPIRDKRQQKIYKK